MVHLLSELHRCSYSPDRGNTRASGRLNRCRGVGRERVVRQAVETGTDARFPADASAECPHRVAVWTAPDRHRRNGCYPPDRVSLNLLLAPLLCPHSPPIDNSFSPCELQSCCHSPTPHLNRRAVKMCVAVRRRIRDGNRWLASMARLGTGRTECLPVAPCRTEWVTSNVYELERRHHLQLSPARSMSLLERLPSSRPAPRPVSAEELREPRTLRGGRPPTLLQSS